MEKRIYNSFKKVYLELSILLEKQRSWKNANLKEIENNKIKLKEIWKNVENAKANTKQTDW